jgi:MtrB/PioB family decaheme-associated outer membrane protein
VNSEFIAVLTTILFAASSAMAQDGGEGFKASGSVGLGVRGSTQNATDKAKLNEYRDLNNGLVGDFNIRGRGSEYYLDAFGENIGRDDRYLDVKGGKYGVFKYQLYDDNIAHNWAFGARTPYDGVGSSTLTANLPNLDTSTWNTFNLREKRGNIGGMFEFTNNSPWYIRADANQVTQRGLKLIGGSQGNDHTDGFVDKPFPVDYKTQNFSLEGGYASKRVQFSVNALHSRFSNNNDLLNWTNGNFGGLDTTTLAADNVYTKLGANGVIRQLPMGSSLAGRVSYSRATNSIPISGTVLNDGGVFDPTNANRASFDGNIIQKTASLSLQSNLSKALDSRVYWNWFQRDNRSPLVTSINLTPGLQCDGGDCVTRAFGYKKNNLGVDVGYRFDPQNKLVLGLDYVDRTRNREDVDQTKDGKASIEYRNSTLDFLDARFKYQRLDRRSHFLQGAAGTDASDPAFLNRFISRFDVANVDQDLFKLVLDAQPAELWNLGFESIYKKNNYKNTVLGRTKDDRTEFNLSVSYGDIRHFRIMTFAELEFVRYDATHRNIDDPASATAFDPFAAPDNNNYNWTTTNKDRNWAIGLGADWLPMERLKLNGSLIWQSTHGTADFTIPTTVVPATPAFPITNYDNTRKVSLNLKGVYKYSKQWDVTAGYAYERYRFSDIAYDGYQFTIPAGANFSYLTGAYAFPGYNVNLLYVRGVYKFE